MVSSGSMEMLLTKIQVSHLLEVRSCHKLSTLLVECEKTQRQKVRLATELLSHTTATAIRKYSKQEEGPATEISLIW
ncbi:hypothetical protein PR048_014237 [Dryococelus australis]|uniref:Uncharacterized protein n=1 Tax=Dryococelus australis TaxID=614101 RepID=A0ABQ9HDU6_9NEOP|nr:hypothetical protein PR048_014237 [Dryococelus australis]